MDFFNRLRRKAAFHVKSRDADNFIELPGTGDAWRTGLSEDKTLSLDNVYAAPCLQHVVDDGYLHGCCYVVMTNVSLWDDAAGHKAVSRVDGHKPVQVFASLRYRDVHDCLESGYFTGKEALRDALSYADTLRTMAEKETDKLVETEPVKVPVKYKDQLSVLQDHAVAPRLFLQNFPDVGLYVNGVNRIVQDEKTGSMDVYFVKTKQESRKMLERWVNAPEREIVAKNPVNPGKSGEPGKRWWDEIERHHVENTVRLDIAATNHDKRNVKRGLFLTEENALAFTNVSRLGLEAERFAAKDLDERLFLHISRKIEPDNVLRQENTGYSIEAVVPVVKAKLVDGDFLYNYIYKHKDDVSELFLVDSEGERSAIGTRKTGENAHDYSMVEKALGNPENAFGHLAMPPVSMELAPEEAKDVKYAMSDVDGKGVIIFDKLDDKYKSRLFCDSISAGKDGGLAITFRAGQAVSLKAAEGNQQVFVLDSRDVRNLVAKNREMEKGVSMNMAKLNDRSKEEKER